MNDPAKLNADVDRIRNWTTDEVIHWAKNVVCVNEEDLEKLRQQQYAGLSLLCATGDSLKSDGFVRGVADKILEERDKLIVATKDKRPFTGSPTRETKIRRNDDVKSKSPKGDDLAFSVDNLLDWLRSHMKDKTKLISRPHILSGYGELKFSLQDRKDALERAKELLLAIYESSSRGESSRENYCMPVCSAMSGIGKTRLLDEFVKLMEENHCDLRHLSPNRLALVLGYGNGHSATYEERSMGSVAGFSWRLLYAVFLEMNSELAWEEFWSVIPKNAADLQLILALKAIAQAKRGDREGGDNDKLALFVGIDEYQLVPRNCYDGNGTDDIDPLVPLLDALLASMTNTPSGVVILPLFAGTDWDKMSLAASSSSSSNTMVANVTTERLVMPLLGTEAMRKAVLGRGDGTDQLLQHELFCRHLFFLGGVPRPCTQYAEECRDWIMKNPTPPLGETKQKFKAVFQRKFAKFFEGVYMKAPREEKQKKEGFTLRELIRLAAYSVRGGSVASDEKPFKELSESSRGHLTFRRLRDASVCILGDDGRLGLPYCFFHYLSNVDAIEYASFADAEKAFMEVLRYLKNHVDHNVFHQGNSPWQQWELFGACFSALRINALFITITSDAKEVPLSRIFEGAKANLMNDHVVKLRPMLPVATECQLSSSLNSTIHLKDEGSRDWVSSGVVVVNGENGKGVDIFYTLELRDSPNNYILVTDQRKRVHGSLDVNKAIQNARINPGENLKQAGIQCVVVALFSMFTCEKLDLPQNSIGVTFEQHADYHGALYMHPAASFCVRVNEDGATALRGLFKNRAQAGATAIIKARNESTIGSIQDLQACLLGENANDLWEDVESLCIFSQ